MLHADNIEGHYMEMLVLSLCACWKLDDLTHRQKITLLHTKTSSAINQLLVTPAQCTLSAYRDARRPL